MCGSDDNSKNPQTRSDAAQDANSPVSQANAPAAAFEANSRTGARLREEATAAIVKVKSLSPREREVLDFIAQGLSIKEIAQSLSVSPKSVETYRARLLEKLEARTPAALMRLAVLVSLIAPSEMDGEHDAGSSRTD